MRIKYLVKKRMSKFLCVYSTALLGCGTVFYTLLFAMYNNRQAICCITHMHCLNCTIIGLKTAMAARKACHTFVVQSFAHRAVTLII